MKNKILILSVITFLLTGILNNVNANIVYDTIPDKKNSEKIKYKIERSCKDSIKQDIENKKIYLYGEASIIYGDIQITADHIQIDWKNKTIFAIGTIDSAGKTIGSPIFSEKNNSFRATEILYNLESKRCIIKEIIVQEGEGYIHGVKVKKQSDNVMYLKNGEYTTCDAKKPHYSIRSNKIKILADKQIFTGPAYITFFNIPTPLFLPFGYFPNNEKRSSGVIIPSYGESTNLGFFLKDGGYYFSLNDYMDLSIKGDIYTKGSWGVRSNLRYKKRYKYNGSFNLNYGNIVNSEKGFQDYSIKRDFFVRWNHVQDPKLQPLINFTANVNAGTSTFHRNNTFNNSNDYLSNTFTSSINFSKRWSGKPFNLSSSISHSQNTQTHIVNLTLPDISLSMNRIFPFQKNRSNGKKYWYDNIGISYNVNTKNQVSNADSLFFDKSTLQSLKSGMRHSIPISSSFKLLKHFTFSQNLNISERWYLKQIEKSWDGTNIITDTINRFTRGSDYSLTGAINTKIYGISQFKKGKIKALRHVLTPNLSFTFRPGFHDERYGVYKTVQNNINGEEETYSIMENGIYGSPRYNKEGNISMSLGNILGIKIRSRKDSLEKIKKIQIIENLSLISSYNIFAEEFNFSYLSLNLRTKLFNKINITHNSNFDPYIITENGRVNDLELFTNKRIARFKSANTSIGFNINDQTFIKESEDSDDEEFYKIPWNINISYIYSIDKGSNNITQQSNKTQTIGISGNIKMGPKWKLGVQSGYDFSNITIQEWWNRFSYTSVNLYRDLHCWEMLFQWIPIGYQRSYTLTIRPKASILKDLKIERRKDWISPDF